MTSICRKAVNAGAPSALFGWTVSYDDEGVDRYLTSTSRTGPGEFSFSLDYVDADLEAGLTELIYTYTISEDSTDAGWTQYAQPVTFYVRVTRNNTTHAMEAHAYSDAACTVDLRIDDLYFFNEYEGENFDLSMIKFVAEINGVPTGTENPDSALIVKKGDIVTYTIRITNTGNSTAVIDEVTDVIPSGLEFLPDRNAGWDYDAGSQGAGTAVRVLAEGIELEPEETIEFTIILRVAQSAASGKTLTNIAEAKGYSKSQHSRKDLKDNADVKVEPDPPPYEPPVIDDDDDDDGKKPPVITEEEDEEEDDDDDDDDNGGKKPPIVDEEDEDGDEEDGGRRRPNIVFPDDEGPENYPEVDFTKRQRNPDVPGGDVRDAPPVPNNPGNRLTPQYNDDGDLIFIEFDDEDVPLGAWTWDDGDGWTFEDFEVPLGGWEELPTTGYFNPMVWLMPLGLAIFGLGVVMSIRLYDRSKRMRRVLSGRRK